VVKLDRLGRNTRDVLSLVHELEEKGASLRVLEPAIDTGGPMGRMVLTVLGMVAEMELVGAASLPFAAGRKHTGNSRCASPKHGVDSGEQIRCDGSFGDKSVGSCFNRRQLHTLFSVDAESDQLQLRETVPDSAY
jgi:hypothetical protein